MRKSRNKYESKATISCMKLSDLSMSIAGREYKVCSNSNKKCSANRFSWTTLNKLYTEKQWLKE